MMERSKAVEFTIRVRPEVARFAELMEQKLRANDHKGHWRGSSLSYLIARLREECGELIDAVLYEEDSTPGHITEEAADVANFAMFIADVAGALDVDADQSIRLNKRALPGEGELRSPWWTCPMCKCRYILSRFSFCPDCGRPIEWVAREPGGLEWWVEDEQVTGGDES
jgi:NTP pyrophosphatase (non-canonical NTP hydrolase)